MNEEPSPSGARPRDRIATAAVAVALVAAGALAWGIQLRPGLEVDARALAQLPREFAGWTAQDVPLSATVESVLRADFNLQRAYLHSTGGLVWFYVGYYGTGRGGRPEHTPRGCYTGAGWAIRESRTLPADPDSGLRVKEYLVEREGRRRLVHFWYRSHRRTGMVGGLDQNLDRLVGRLFEGRADGALVRLSTPLEPGEEISARSRLLGFASLVDPLLAQHWPSERARTG